MPRTVHVIGAGLAGLSAAVAVAARGDRVIVHEATSNVGGRCRSYFDHASGMTIDNGNHLILSGNRAALSFLRTIGAIDRMRWRESASFPFADVATGERWEIDFGAGRLPWWLFDAKRRVPNTNVTDYLALARLVWRQRDRPIGTVIKCSGAIYERLLRPLLTSALNVDPPEGSALLAAALLRETIVAGGQACRPLIARTGLSHAFIDPALAFLEQHGGEVRTNDEVRALDLTSDRVGGLAIGGATAALGPDDIVISAVPPASATTLLPELTVPTEYRAIFNLHFRRPPPEGAPDILGVTGGLTEWIFCYPERISVTISAADALMNEPREPIAQRVWGEICVALRLKEPLPAWQIVRERRATFAAIPTQQTRRPGPRTQWRNLFLAGDWTATGLPATIEGAVRSGQRAAALAVEAAA
jgi:squalene-associated FAD-dependent desaturase